MRRAAGNSGRSGTNSDSSHLSGCTCRAVSACFIACSLSRSPKSGPQSTFLSPVTQFDHGMPQHDGPQAVCRRRLALQSQASLFSFPLSRPAPCFSDTTSLAWISMRPETLVPSRLCSSDACCIAHRLRHDPCCLDTVSWHGLHALPPGTNTHVEGGLGHTSGTSQASVVVPIILQGCQGNRLSTQPAVQHAQRCFRNR
jgi:hypothetical protein